MKNKKASILGAALVILGIMLAIAIGVSTVSVLERKSSIGSSRSITAYQSADTGVEKTLNAINKVLLPTDAVGAIAAKIGAPCDISVGLPDSGLFKDSGGKFKVELKDSSEQKIRCDSGSLISSISSVKSTGSSPQESRAIEVALAETSNACAICQTCGGNWPNKTGGFATDDDGNANIKVMRGLACVDPMQNRSGDTLGEISLCCK
jgi:hypothetical protein